MTALGVFRDDYYNAISVLPNTQQSAFTTSQVGTVLPAAAVAGAGDAYVTYSGQAVAQSQTTDTAANIIAQLQQAVAVAAKAGASSFAAQVNPPAGVPNLFNLTWTLSIVNQNTASGALTLTGGTGVTLATNGAASASVVAVGVTAIYVVTITGPNSITLTRVQ